MLTERINNSMALLDEMCPDWLDMVDLDILAMHDPRVCVAGQTVGFGELVNHIMDVGSLSDVNERYAFAASVESHYPALNAAWRAAIRERRA